MPITEVINDAGWPAEFVELIVDRDRVDPHNIHVTSLSGCLRQTVLAATEKYTVYTSNLYPLLRGVLLHAGIEALLGDKVRAQGGVVEKHLMGKVGNITISGTLDYLKDKVLRDWKVPMRSKPPSMTYIQQLNVYNWLLASSGVEPADELELVAFEPSKLRTYRIPKWAPEDTQQRVTERLARWQGELPPPDGIDLGYCAYCPVQVHCFGKSDMDEYITLLEDDHE